jgi:DNA-binding response OmpR family regulator
MQNNPSQTLFSSSDSDSIRGPAQILIVDDDEALRCSTALLLRRDGFIVDAVGDGRAAQEYLKDHEIKLLITDIYMPDCDGLELILATRRQSRRPQIIAMTGGTFCHRPDILSMAHSLGADAELFKPFDGETLLLMVRKFLNHVATARLPAIRSDSSPPYNHR